MENGDYIYVFLAMSYFSIQQYGMEMCHAKTILNGAEPMPMWVMNGRRRMETATFSIRVRTQNRHGHG